MYALRRRLDDGPQAGLTVPECVLHAFALIYVVDQDVPAENGPAGIPKGKPTHLKPTIRAVEASEARLEVIWLTRCELRSEDLRHAREILRIKDRINHILAFHTKQPVEKIANDADRDFIMDAAQAKEYGIVDQVISRRER